MSATSEHGASAALARSSGRRDVRVAATLVLATIGAVLTAWYLAGAWLDTGRVGWDAITYLAAGERLNAGHALYALGPGDRWIWINPPYWTVPLFYPPTIAVIWKPLAALPSEAGVALWTLANGVALAIATVVIVARAGWRAALCMAVLAPVLAFELKVGNMHGFIMAGMVLAYRRPRIGGLAVGLLTAVKLTPAIILIWLFVNGRMRDAVVGGLIGAFALLGAVAYVGIDQVGVYVAAVLHSEPSVISIPGLLDALGIPGAHLIAWGLTGFLLLEVVLLRGKPLSWVVAVFAMVVGSPVVNIPTLLLLLAAWLAYPAAPGHSLRALRTQMRQSSTFS